ncbi:hypothetical protein TrLO_g11852 [Triparma laevis f. longispina]|uniref:NAD(P)H-hydrate epimerase n=1 Tax=Triparma laevis f. longispina TaxID=1714387 RepID=A0A9W7FQP6_9STRA|nr:hypothetical protein TrLO_g11852 [Triparma laevis f. longispina]
MRSLLRPVAALAVGFTTTTYAFSASTSFCAAAPHVPYISSKTAAAIDVSLMNPSASPAYTLPQLMELAGLTVSTAFHKTYPPSSHVLVFVGPGNNGGDGLVAARHLKLWGYDVTCVVPKLKDAFFEKLRKQAEDCGCEIITKEPREGYASLLTPSTVIIDSVFGFSATGPPRAPYNDIVPFLHSTTAPVMAVDIPSGWSVDSGDVNYTNYAPDSLISLTAPKLGSKGFKGRHWLGGHFVPKRFEAEFGIKVDGVYEGGEIVRELTPGGEGGEDVDGYSVVYVTAPNGDLAQVIASELVKSKTVACVNIIPAVKSVYAWKGNVEVDDEVLMMIKTRKERVGDVEKIVKKLHEYETPEVLVVGVEGGSKEYLKWLGESVDKRK